MFRRDFYEWRYDDAVPAFITTGTNLVVYRKLGMSLIDIDSLIEQCAQQGYNLAAPEIGEAPADWDQINELPMPSAPGYGTGTDPEAPLAPMNMSAPYISPTSLPNTSSATCQPGIWYGVPAPTLTYQWLLDGSPLAGETQQVYDIQTTDVGKTLSCVVTATNASGSTQATTNVVTVYRPFNPTQSLLDILRTGQGWHYPNPPVNLFQNYQDVSPSQYVLVQDEPAGLAIDGVGGVDVTESLGSNLGDASAIDKREGTEGTVTRSNGIIRFENAAAGLSTAVSELIENLTVGALYKFSTRARKVSGSGEAFFELRTGSGGGGSLLHPIGITFSTSFDTIEDYWVATQSAVHVTHRMASSSILEIEEAGYSIQEVTRTFSGLGDELFSGFTSLGTGWVDNGDGSATGTAVPAGPTGQLVTDAAIETGKAYFVEVDVVRTTGAVGIMMPGSSKAFEPTIGVTESFFEVLIATGNGFVAFERRFNDYSGTVTVKSIREIPGLHATQENDANRLLYDVPEAWSFNGVDQDITAPNNGVYTNTMTAGLSFKANNATQASTLMGGDNGNSYIVRFGENDPGPVGGAEAYSVDGVRMYGFTRGLLSDIAADFNRHHVEARTYDATGSPEATGVRMGRNSTGGFPYNGLIYPKGTYFTDLTDEATLDRLADLAMRDTGVVNKRNRTREEVVQDQPGSSGLWGIDGRSGGQWLEHNHVVPTQRPDGDNWALIDQSGGSSKNGATFNLGTSPIDRVLTSIFDTGIGGHTVEVELSGTGDVRLYLIGGGGSTGAPTNVSLTSTPTIYTVIRDVSDGGGFGQIGIYNDDGGNPATVTIGRSTYYRSDFGGMIGAGSFSPDTPQHPGDYSYMWQDDAGQTPVTADGDDVGLILSKGNGSTVQIVNGERVFSGLGPERWIHDELTIVGESEILGEQRYRIFSPDGSPSTFQTAPFGAISKKYVGNYTIDSVVAGSIVWGDFGVARNTTGFHREVITGQHNHLFLKRATFGELNDVTFRDVSAREYLGTAWTQPNAANRPKLAAPQRLCSYNGVDQWHEASLPERSADMYFSCLVGEMTGQGMLLGTEGSGSYIGAYQASAEGNNSGAGVVTTFVNGFQLAAETRQDLLDAISVSGLKLVEIFCDLSASSWASVQFSHQFFPGWTLNGPAYPGEILNNPGWIDINILRNSWLDQYPELRANFAT